MWGNRLGWGISAAIVVVAMFLAYQLFQLSQPTPPAGDLVPAARPLTLADAVKPLLPPFKPLGDAGEAYRDAIADYAANHDVYEKVTASREYDRAAVAQLKGLNDLLAAADCPTMDLFRSKPDALINFGPTGPDAPAPDGAKSLEALQAVGNAAVSVAALAAYDKEYDAARKYGTAVLVLGYHLYRERLTYEELSAGIAMMASGSAALKDVADRTSDTAAAAGPIAFDAARKAEYEQVTKVWRILSGQGEANIAEHAGDFFQLAADATADPVWRVEAVRRLGRLPYNAHKAADQVRARRVLRQLADDSSLSPALHQAAVSARDMTSYQNQSAR